MAPIALEITSHEQIKGLVRAAQFDVGLERHGIVALHQRIQEFMNADRLLLPVTFGKVVTFQHARQVIVRTQFDDVLCPHVLHPAAVELHARCLGVQRFEDLPLIRLGIGQDLLLAQHLPRFGDTGRVTDHAGKIPDQENDLMPKFLKMTELLNQHDMAEMEIRRGGIESGFHPQGSPLLE